jgi:lipopolysaccharide transport system ATP-binding protein
MRPVIRIENLAKQYRLGQVGTGTLSHDLNRWWHLVRGKEDPYLKIGDTNDRTRKGDSEYVWALKDVSFDVGQGEVLGIIGRNGAGKSTLLKLLSRTTAPTQGNIKIKGRVASLLEVGTGFHPELSGRENIYLNGAIMGMTKEEIRRKFDEIVEFAGVERYIETPVKRYSSGMYVRLAFAVAAHLDPEILIVDEVLAVGDQEFQQKCLGKMDDVSKKEGRTVLFVSHNMASIKTLCTRVISMRNGMLDFSGTPEETISRYLTSNFDEVLEHDLEAIPNRRGTTRVIFSSFHLENPAGDTVKTVLTGEDVTLVFRILIRDPTVKEINLGWSLHNRLGNYQGHLFNSFQDFRIVNDGKSGHMQVRCTLRNFPLAAGRLYLKGHIFADGLEADWPKVNLASFEVEEGDFFGTGKKAVCKAPFLIKGEWSYGKELGDVRTQPSGDLGKADN